MSLGQGPVQVQQKRDPTAGPPFVVGAARNGLSVEAGFIVLGQNVGAVGDPAQLLANREIPLNLFSIVMTQAGQGQFRVDPPGAGYIYNLGDYDNGKNFIVIRGGNIPNQFAYIDDAGQQLLFIGDTFASPQTSLLSPNLLHALLLDETTNQAQLIAGIQTLSINDSNVLKQAVFNNPTSDIKLGINRSTPIKNLDVLGNRGVSNSTNAQPYSTDANILSTDMIAVTGDNHLTLEKYGNSAGSNSLIFYKTRGANPDTQAAVVNADQLGTLEFFGVDTGASVRRAARVLYSAGTVGATFVGGEIFWQTTNSTGTLGNRMKLTENGSLGVGTITPNASAKLHLVSTTQGFLPPVMTTVEKNAIAAPANGLVVYDSTLAKLCVFTGAVWETVVSV